MGFRVVPQTDSQNITIDSLTLEMIVDLIKFYGVDPEIAPEDVESRHNLNRAGVNSENITYPIIPKTVVRQFYDQLDLLKKTVIDVVCARYHTGPVWDETDPLWVWGETPATLEELKYWVYFLVQRDFYEKGSWIYEFSEGHFEMIKPFIEQVVDLMIMANDHGQYEDFVTIIKTHYA